MINSRCGGSFYWQPTKNMNNDLYLFVYGTLRRACSSGAHRTYLAGAEFIDTARVHGNLYRVSYYPALVLDATAGLVLGEVYRLASAGQLSALDAYEECTFPALPAQEYQRVSIPLITDNGIRINAWIYAYQRSCEHLELISSGDFLNP